MDLTQVYQALIAGLTKFAEALLAFALPILAAAGARWLIEKYHAERQRMIDDGNARLVYLLESVARLAVRAAEQEFGGAKGREKKAAAVQLVSDFLESRGVRLDETAIAGAVEAAVLEEFNRPAEAVPA